MINFYTSSRILIVFKMTRPMTFARWLLAGGGWWVSKSRRHWGSWTTASL